MVARPVNYAAPPAPPQNSDLSLPEKDEEAQRIRMAKLQMLEEATKAKTGVSITAPRSGSSSQISSRPPETRQEMLSEISRVRQQIGANRSDNPTAAYQVRLAQIKDMNYSGGNESTNSQLIGSAPTLMQASDNRNDNTYAQFDNKGDDRWQLKSQAQAPRTPYELRAGFVIPATLISGINSELPGQIVAQVSQNVSDTATGTGNSPCSRP